MECFRPLRKASALQVGTVWINDWALIYDEFEEGGAKQSGLGRLNGMANTTYPEAILLSLAGAHRISASAT